MIYIDARDPLSLKQGVIDFLDLTEKELEQVFATMDSVEGNLYDWVKSFLEDYGIDLPLDSIQMFHLTRRLNGTDLTSNNNLEQLLLGETTLSDFFKRYDVTCILRPASAGFAELIGRDAQRAATPVL